jgi:two-component system, NtrC family, response regulator AtoC
MMNAVPLPTTIHDFPTLTEVALKASHARMLIVDEQPSIREACRRTAAGLGYSVTLCESGERALRLIGSQTFDITLFSVNQSLRSPLVVRDLKARCPEMEIVLLSSDSNIDAAIAAIKAGAYDYIVKPFSLHQLSCVLERVSSHLTLKADYQTYRAQLKPELGYGNLVGTSPEMERLYRMIAKAANCTHPALISGEGGSGKEATARAIHDASPFREHPFIVVDCASVDPERLETQLFGWAQGSPDGGVKAGVLSLARNGTVLLKDIGELPISVQGNLQRALQQKQIRPLGGSESVPVSMRILASTDKDLAPLVAKGSFRRDLFYSLNVLSLRVPALRERRQDVALLASRFLDRASISVGRTLQVSADAMQALNAYDWPGNVRELENCILRSSLACSGEVVTTFHLPSFLTQAHAGASDNPVSSEIVPMCEVEKVTIMNAIARLGGDKLKAAELLGIGKTTLYRKLKEYGVH